MPRFIIGLICLLAYTAVSAQVHERLHWLIPVDSIEQVQVDLVDPVTIENWQGNQIMITSEITVYNATKGLLKFFVEDQKRYDVIDTLQGVNLLLESYQTRRATIQSKGQNCYEQVQVKVFLPEEFMFSDENLWIKKEE